MRGWHAGSAGPGGSTVRAIRCYAYGSADVLQLQDIDVPAVGDHDVLVRVQAASVNPLDVHVMRGTPYLVRAQAGCPGRRPAGSMPIWPGQVEAVGKNVTRFQPGDEVFGGAAAGRSPSTSASARTQW